MAMALLIFLYTVPILFVFYLFLRILLWSIEDLAMYCFTSWKGIETFSGFVIGFDIKPLSIIIIHIPTRMIQHYSYYQIKRKMQSNHTSTVTLIEYYLHRLLYHYLCKLVLFNTIYYITNQFKSTQLYHASTHSTTLYITTKIVSLIIQHIHPFIHLTDQIRVSLKCKDALQRTHTLSKPTIALLNHNTALLTIHHINLQHDSNDIDLSLHQIQAILQFNLHRLFHAQYVSTTIDQIQLNINSDTSSDITNASDNSDNVEQMPFITQSVMKQFAHVLQTKVKICIKSSRICMRMNKTTQCLDDLPDECMVSLNVDNVQLYHFGINAMNTSTTCNIKCDAIRVELQHTNHLTLRDLDIEYQTDIVSLLLSPIAGYRLPNAMCIDHKHAPHLNIKFGLFEINIDDLLFPNYCALMSLWCVDQPQHMNESIPMLIQFECNRLDVKIKLQNPFESHLDDAHVSLLHVIARDLTADVWIPMQLEDVSYVIAIRSLCIDLPSIFESAVNYKHKLSPLYHHKHRLIQFNRVAFSGMKQDEIPLFCCMDQVWVQYHPAMTEFIAPIVSMIQTLQYLLSAQPLVDSPMASTDNDTQFGIQIEYNTLHCDVPYYMEFIDTKHCNLFNPNVLSLFHFDMDKGTLLFKRTCAEFTWIIKAINTKFYCEKYNFLNCDQYQLHGVDAFDEHKVPKLDITGSDIYGEWDPLLQLKLMSCIMPVVATAINLKYDLYRLHLAPFARYESEEEIETMQSNLNLRFAFASLDPKPQSFIGNFECIEEYFKWYHIDRKPHLQDRFTWPALHVENICLILNLCEEFKLNAVVGVFHSDFMPKEIQISDTNLYLLDPAADTLASMTLNDTDHLRVLMMHCDQLIFSRTGVRDVLHPQNYDEEHEMMTDYLDVSLYLENRTDIILPYALSPRHAPIEWMDIMQHKVFPKMCSALAVWQSMLGLNELSLKRLGPGYECTLNIPSTGFNLEADELNVSILDEYLESFLSQLNPVMSRHLADVAAFDFECVIDNKSVNLKQLSRNYIQNVKLYRDTTKPTDALLSVCVKGVTCFVGLLSGNGKARDKYGNFYDTNNILNCMSNLDTSTKLDTEDVRCAFRSLIGRYIWANVQSVQVMLRNFEAPLAVVQNISMNGALIVARHDTYPQYLFTDTVPIKHCPNLGGALFGDVSIIRSNVPFKLFHDLEIGGNKLNVVYCPSYIYALNDLIIRIIKFPRIIPELLDEFGSDLAVWDLLRFLFMGRIVLDFKNISLKLSTKSRSLSLPSAAVNLNIDSMKSVIHNSHIMLSIEDMSVDVDEFNDKTKYSPLLTIPELIINAGLHWSCHKNSDENNIEDHWVYPIAVDNHEEDHEEWDDQKQDHDIFERFRTHDMTLSLSLKIPQQITFNVYQPLVRSLFSFGKSFMKQYRFPVMHSSKKYGYDRYHKMPFILPKKTAQTTTQNTRFAQIVAGIWINHIMIEKISIHLWFKDDSVPSNAITFSLSLLMVSGEFDKIRKTEDIKSDCLWKVNVIPNFIQINHNMLYYMENNKLSINDIEIRTTRNKTMNQTLETLNPMRSTIEGHIVICEIYENERRYGLKWSKQLLPTDRPKWSSINGAQLDKDEDFVLPKDWIWVTDWHWKWSSLLLHDDDNSIIKHKLKRKKNKYKCDKNGWQYAFDFPERKNWSTKPSIHTHTRRRRWIRIRRYQQSMDSARDRFRQKDSQPLKLFKTDEFIKVSNICYLQSNELSASTLIVLPEDVSSSASTYNINEIFRLTRTAPKQRCLDSIFKRHKKLASDIHDKRFSKRLLSKWHHGNDPSVSPMEPKYTIQIGNLSANTMGSGSSPVTRTLSSSNSSNIIISPNRGTMRLSNWEQPLITPTFVYPDSAQSNTVLASASDASYFESQLIRHEMEEKKQMAGSADALDHMFGVVDTKVLNAMDIDQFEHQHKPINNKQPQKTNSLSRDSSDISSSLTVNVDWPNEFEFNLLKEVPCLHSVRFHDLHCVLNRKVRDIVIVISDLYIRSITDLIETDLANYYTTDDSMTDTRMHIMDDDDDDDDEELKSSQTNNLGLALQSTPDLLATPLNSILSYDFDVDKDDIDYEESGGAVPQSLMSPPISMQHADSIPFHHYVEPSPSVSKTTLSGDGIYEDSSTVTHESPLNRDRQTRTRLHVAPTTCIEEQERFESDGLIEVPLAMIQVINTQFNLESTEKRACCVSGLGRIAVRIESFWDLYGTTQEAMRIKIECRELDSWIAPTDIDPEMRPWIKRSRMESNESSHRLDANYTPTGAAMRNKQKKQKEQSVLQLIMHPIAVNTQIIIRDESSIGISICSVELSLNDHQFHDLMGIVQTVIMPTSPVAVEYLTNELEIQHSNEDGMHTHDLQNIIDLRCRLTAEIHQIEWMLSSQYARFVMSNEILSSVQDTFYNHLNEKEQTLKRKKLRLNDLERKWSIILAISKVKAAENQPIDEKLTNLFLTLKVESFRFESFLLNVGDEPFLSVIMDGFVIQMKEIEDLSGLVAIEIENISIYNLLAIKDPNYHSWKDIITPWNMMMNNNTRDKVMISIQMKHQYKKGFREIRNAEFNIAPLRIKITMDIIDTLIEFMCGKNLQKQKKARRKETKKRVSSNIHSGTNVHQSISTKQKIKNSLSKTAKKMMLKPPTQQCDHNNSNSSMNNTELQDIGFELEMKEEYQLITQFRNHAHLIIKKQTEFIKIWRLRVGSIYLLLNFTKARSTNNFAFKLPSVFDMKLKIEPKTYNARTNKQALHIMNDLKKDYLKTLITKLPNTYLKHSFAQMFFHNTDNDIGVDRDVNDNDSDLLNDDDDDAHTETENKKKQKKRKMYRLKSLSKSKSYK